MTPKQAKELLPVIQAFADGAAIEWTHGRTPEWFTTKFPSWDAEYKYRIKPKPDGSERVRKMLESGKPVLCVLCGTSNYSQKDADRKVAFEELAKRDAVIKELEAEIDLRGKRMELLWKVLMLDESEQYHYEGYDELRSWFNYKGKVLTTVI